MEEELFKLAYDYSINKKIVDEEYIVKVIEIVIDAWGLEDHVHEIVLFDDIQFRDNRPLVSGYVFIDKDIYVDINELKARVDINEIMNTNLSDINKYMYYNLTTTESIIHELIHAKQHKMLVEGCNNTIEGKLIKASVPLTDEVDLVNKHIPDRSRCRLRKKYKVYKKNYDIAPFERFAILGACKILRDIIPSNNRELFESRFIINHYYNGRQLEKYNREGMSPTHLYLSRTNQIQLWNEIKNELLSLDDKLYLGLELTNEEYDEAFSRLVLK